MENNSIAKYLKYLTYLFASLLMNLIYYSSFLPVGPFSVLSHQAGVFGADSIINKFIHYLQIITGMGGIILFYYTIILIIKDVFSKNKN